MENGDYIKREDALKAIERISCDTCKRDKCMCKACEYGDSIDEIEDIPPADVVEVRHGTSKGYEDSYGWKDVCSLCGCEFTTSRSANYCPNCGARMDGDDYTIELELGDHTETINGKYSEGIDWSKEKNDADE